MNTLLAHHHHRSRHPHHILLWHPYELTLATISLSIVTALMVAALFHTDRVANSPCVTSVENGFCNEP